MCYLSDTDINSRLAERGSGRIIIDPLGPNAIQPASVDVRIGQTLLRPDTPPDGIIDPTDPDTIVTRRIEFGPKRPIYHIHPGEKLLGATHEKLTVPNDIIASLEGKSSLARLFLLVHVTAGIADPGWQGRLTFEFVNIADYPIRLTHKMPIAQIVFSTLLSPATRPYGHPDLRSKYQGDMEPKASMYHLNRAP